MARLRVAALLAVVLAACGGDPYVPAGAVREPAPVVAVAQVPDDDGDFEFLADPGGLLIVYFGYTSCPDICPTSMSDLRGALAAVGDLADRIGVAMVTVDPERDSDEVIAAYVETFFPRGRGLRIDDSDLLAEVAGAFGAYYSVEEDDEGGVDVVHSAWLYVVDETGRLLLAWPFGTDRVDIAADIEHLIKEQ
ncbi:MAG: SCO family protein [Acidimicrobiia bacterium]|nr:MAG: SCO family protein [Acidimicrobiia bacterium]